MSACIVKAVTAVEPHPNPEAGHLNVVRTADAQFVSQKLEDGAPRYRVGDLVVHIPDGALLPTWLLRRLGLYDEVAGKGTQKGELGNRIKAGNFRGFRSEGALLPATEVPGEPSPGAGEDVTARLDVTFAKG